MNNENRPPRFSQRNKNVAMKNFFYLKPSSMISNKKKRKETPPTAHKPNDHQVRPTPTDKSRSHRTNDERTEPEKKQKKISRSNSQRIAPCVCVCVCVFGASMEP